MVFFRRFAALLGIIVLALLIAVFVIWLRIPNFVASMISTKLGVPVEIEDITIGSKQISVDEIEIGNPKGFLLDKAFSTQLIEVDAPLFGYLDKEIEIDYIGLEKIYVGLEFKEGTSEGNWTEIMQNVKSGKPEKEEEPKPDKKERTVFIRHLKLTDINIDLLQTQNLSDVKKLNIDELEFHDLSSEGGFPMNQIISAVFTQLITEILLKEGLKNLLDGVLQPVKPLEQFTQPLKKLFGKKAVEKPRDAA